MHISDQGELPSERERERERETEGQSREGERERERGRIQINIDDASLHKHTQADIDSFAHPHNPRSHTTRRAKFGISRSLMTMIYEFIMKVLSVYLSFHAISSCEWKIKYCFMKITVNILHNFSNLNENINIANGTSISISGISDKNINQAYVKLHMLVAIPYIGHKTDVHWLTIAGLNCYNCVCCCWEEGAGSGGRVREKEANRQEMFASLTQFPASFVARIIGIERKNREDEHFRFLLKFILNLFMY